MADPSIQVSWGELLDKITILEIKRRRVRRPEAQANIERELLALKLALPDQSAWPAGAMELWSALAAVNQRLWSIEDGIREREAAGRFDAEFIQLARAVYHENDERGRIKRSINMLLRSDIVEEKQYNSY